MTQTVRWGVLGCAGIAAKAVIPAIQSSRLGRVTAIASRELDKATEMAARFGIAKAYGSYEDLLADPEIDAIYNPLPNHLHVPLTIRALEHGKPVLCEKPVALDATEAMALAVAQKAAGLPVAEGLYGPPSCAMEVSACADRRGAARRGEGDPDDLHLLSR